jgi:UPF0755 protein
VNPLRFVVRCLLILIVIGLLGYLYLEREMNTFHNPSSTASFEVSPGMSARSVVKMLRERGVIADERLTMFYLVISGNRKALRAGEYLFDRPVTTREVIDTLVSGRIYLHRFTVPEGLTVAEVAMKWQEQGFGKAEEFVTAAKESVDLVRDFEGENARASVEGYLFPETYFFAIRTTPRRAIEAMVGRFRSVLAQLETRLPSESWPLGLRDTLVLASLVEAEAQLAEERPLIASVFVNRLRLKILLQCDPTVIYALEKANRYRGQLSRADLKFDSPYNTYRYPGLPPGPIANPGMRALEAVMRPASTRYLYFVRTTGGRHTFSETLAAHNRAVAAYHAMKD